MKKLAITLALLASAATAEATQIIEAVVIRVGDRIVTRSQYSRRLQDVFREIEQNVPPAQVNERKEEIRKNLTNEMISELLIKDRADRLGLSVTEAEIKEATARLKQQYGIATDQQFEESLKSSGLTLAEMQTRLRDTLITNKVFARELRNRDELSDRELRERYDREKESYRLPERARLREIVILRPEGDVAAGRQRAEKIAADARVAGTDFAKLATTVSESGTKEKGGDLGEVTRGELLADLDKAVFNSTAGTVIGPIETRSGWHILRVEQRLPSEVPAFESVKDRLKRDAGEDAFQRDLKAYIDRLRKDAFIQIHEANIPQG